MPLRFRFRIHKLHRKLLRVAHIMGPTLLAFAFAGVSSGVAHAQGTMDFSGATTLMQTFKTFAIYAGAVICLGGLIFAGIRMMSGRFHFTTTDRAAHIRSGGSATVEKIGEDGTYAVRMDNGKSVELTSDQAQHIEYGYAVDTMSRTAADRVLVTGNAPQLAEQQEAFARLSPHLRDLAIYTSDSRALGLEKEVPGAEIALSQDAPSPTINSLSTSSGPQIEPPGMGIGL
jgi:hypothetical protein